MNDKIIVIEELRRIADGSYLRSLYTEDGKIVSAPSPWPVSVKRWEPKK